MRKSNTNGGLEEYSVLRDSISITKGKKPKIIYSEPFNQQTLPYVLIDGFDGNYQHFTDDVTCRIAKKSDVLLVWDGERAGLSSYGHFGYIGSTLAAVRVNDPKLYSKYLFYTLERERAWLRSNSEGTGVPHLSRWALESISYFKPPLPEQQKIAAILSSVDDVIEKTRAQIDKLKDLKTGMMQELLTKGIGHTEFKDSPVGQIPVGWKCKTIGQLADFVTSGSRGWAQYYSEAGSIFIRIGNLTREHINLRFNDIVYVSPPESAEGRRTRVQLGDILISITADLGVIGVVNESIGEAYVNQHISLVRLIDPTIARWIGHFLMFEDTQKQFVESNDAGAKAGLNLSAIRNIVVAIPKQQERDKIVVILDKIDEDVVLKRSKLDRLISIKKALMQDLLTGKVRVNVD